MAGGQVGRLSVRVLPDTSQFRRDLKKAMERAEKSVAPTMSINLRVTKKSLANVKRQLQGIEATVPVGAELTRAGRKRVQEQLDDMDATADVDADVDTTAAAARLRAFTRPRTVPLVVSVSKASLAKATGALAALSGARVLGDFGRRVRDAVANLDRSLPSLAAGTTAIASLGAAGLAATSNLFALGASIASIAPAALALPGILAGFGVGLGVMIAALADAGTVLSDLGPRFSELQDTISSNFWGRAEAPIRNLADNVLPILNQRLGEIGVELGTFTGSLANAFSTPANLGLLDGMMVNLRDSISIASAGISDFVDAIMGLGAVGASYLPALAGWFNDISSGFSEWISLNTDNGKLFEWIDSGIAALQDLGRVLSNTGGILGGFATAAANAGGANLGALADGLEKVNAAVNGPAFQGALTTVLQGAHDAMGALGPGFSALGDAFVSFAPTLAEVLRLAGEIGSVALAGIASALEQPAFQNGLSSFFDGVLVGVEAILPHMPALADAFGAVAEFAGTLAAVLGPVLGAAIGALAPVVTELAAGLGPIAEVLGGVMVSAIEAVAPLIQQVATAISEWVQQNPEFAAGLLVAAAAIGGLVLGAISLVSALAPVITAVLGVVTGLAGLGVTLSGAAAAIGIVLGVIALLVASIGTLAALFIYAWQTSESFRQAIVGFGAAVMAFMQPVIGFITGTLLPLIIQVAQSFYAMVLQIVDALVPMITVIIQIVTAIIERMTPIVSFILSVLAPVFTFLADTVSAAFTFIGTIISTVINVITSILQVFLAVIQGDWSAAWAAIKNVVAVVWNGIKAVVSAAINFVQSVTRSGLNAIKGVWNAVWSGIKSFVTAVWSAIVSAITGFISNLVSRVVTFVNNVKDSIRNGFNTAKETAISAFRELVSGVTGKIEDLLGRVREIPGDIKSGLGDLGSLLFSAGQDVIRGLINGIKDMASGAVDAAKGVVGDAVDGAKNLLGINSPSKVFMEIGEYTGEGLIIGLEHQARGVNAAMSAMVEPPGLPPPPPGSGSTGSASSGMHLSDSSIVRLADALASRPLVWKIGQREFQAAVLDAGKANRRPFVTS